MNDSAAIPGAFVGEYEAWFAEQRRDYIWKHPPPVVAWDASSLYRQIKNHTDRFLRHVRPEVESWWRERGYVVDWKARTASPVARCTEAANGN